MFCKLAQYGHGRGVKLYSIQSPSET